MARYVFGTPSAKESALLWLPAKDSSVPTGDEFEDACEFLEKKLRTYLRSTKLRRDACYLRGDFWGDRTQYLEVDELRALTPSFFQTVSDWLKELEGQWRVAIPHELLPGGAIIVYDRVVRFLGDNANPPVSLAEVLPQHAKSTSRSDC
ncbi:hypothetical protein DES53_10725 [Roseimicrobium gellanilyticum]|uniref:Uncharacterized protein n=1 Tax=Roseimicrobium gellanilyticum TaxID=748857 RepID=A0A366HGY4_9BACT|nr:hypothetical protein [Roseimicrobium gellanilyticum]RBP41196.1 hypothetical protein DES53_10725 [Roseimicrobium gellanilyticum]